MSFEPMHAPLIPRAAFLRRIARSILIGLGFVAVSLAMGMAGYHGIAGLSWIDSLLNASMILTGMGPVDPMRTNGAKIFASAYALFSGVAFLSMVAVVVAPVVHRFMHKYHLETDEDAASASGKASDDDRAAR